MIYEVRTYTLKPQSLPEVLNRFEEGYEFRKKYSEMIAFFYSEIGPLNQIIHIWPYADAGERESIRAAAAKDPKWPPNTMEFLLTMESEIYIPFPCSPEMKPGKFGPYYEMRSYTIQPGTLPETMKRWESSLEDRMTYSPLSVVMYTDLGPLNKYLHIWPYESLNARQEIRSKVKEAGKWPAPGGAKSIVTQENKIVLPAPFSPMQ